MTYIKDVLKQTNYGTNSSNLVIVIRLYRD